MKIDYKTLPKELNKRCECHEITEDRVEHYHKYLKESASIHHYGRKPMIDWRLAAGNN